MAISNIKAAWSSGDLTFYNKATNATLFKIDDGGTCTIGTAPNWTTSNVTTSRSISGTETNAATVANALATLVDDLISLGLLQ